MLMSKILLRSSTGVKCAVLEKSSGFSRHPQAHFINNRSMEVFAFSFVLLVWKCLEDIESLLIKVELLFWVDYSCQVFRKLNGLADEILRYQPPVDLWRKFIYCTSITGPVLGSVDHMKPQGDFYLQILSVEKIESFRLIIKMYY